MRMWKCLVFEYKSMVGYEYMIGLVVAGVLILEYCLLVRVCVCNECYDFY